MEKGSRTPKRSNDRRHKVASLLVLSVAERQLCRQ
jgi:hypothetical protein